MRVSDASRTSEIAQNAISKSEHVWHITGSKYPNRDRTTGVAPSERRACVWCENCKATMAEALSIDMDEMMAILAETEPEHSHATDDMTIELNVVPNIMTDAERSDMSRGVSHLPPVRHVSLSERSCA